MMTVIGWFREGGLPMYFVLLIDGLATVLWGLATMLAVAGLFTRIPRAVVWASVAFTAAAGLVAGLVGVAGWQYGLSELRAAIPLVAPDQVAAIVAIGEHEASRNLYFGAASCALVLLSLALPVPIALLGKSEPAPE